MKTVLEVLVALPLRNLVGGASTVKAQGETVRQLLDNLDSQFPGLKERLVSSERGELRGAYIILLNDEDTRSLQGLETPLKDNDVVNILVVLSGG